MLSLRRNLSVLIAVLVLLAGCSLIHVLVDQGRMNRSMVLLIDLIGINVILAVSLNLINGITGQFSLGHAGFMAVGAYLSAFLTKDLGLALPPASWAATPALAARGAEFVGLLVCGGLAAALAGLIVGIPSLRLRGDYLAIVTLGFGEIARIIIRNTEAVGAASGLHDIPQLTTTPMIYAWAIVCVLVVWRLVHSSIGKGFLAVREDEIAAAAVGINTTRYKVMAFVIGSFWAGVAGGLFAHLEGNLDPNDFSFLRSAIIVTMVVLGGLSSTTGAILAASLLTLLSEGLRMYAASGGSERHLLVLGHRILVRMPGVYELRLVIFPLILILVMLLRPQGLMGGREWIRPGRWRTRGRATDGAGPESRGGDGITASV